MPMISLFKLVLVYKANGNDGEIGGGGGGGGGGGELCTIFYDHLLPPLIFFTLGIFLFLTFFIFISNSSSLISF